MVSFSCENCGDVLTKKKLDQHRNRCNGASFTCLDCMVHFEGTSYRSHTSCITEDQKYQGALYKEKKPKGGQQPKEEAAPAVDNSQAVVPRSAYVEDENDAQSGAVAIVDAPPHAPSPPPPENALPPVNVFDFLEAATPREPRMIHNKGYHHEANDSDLPDARANRYDEKKRFAENGFGYGAEPLQPSFDRYQSYVDLAQPSPIYPDGSFVTPAPKNERHKTKGAAATAKSTDKKRKRHDLDELDMNLVREQAEQDAQMPDAPSLLHSGLTGGLHRLLTRPEFPPSPDYSGGDGVGASPLSPMKRTKHSNTEKDRGRTREPQSRKTSTSTTHSGGAWVRPRKSKRETTGDESDRERRRHHRERRRRRSSSSASQDEQPKPMKAIEYYRKDSTSVEPNAENGALVLHRHSNSKAGSSRTDLFFSMITKGPDSERGCSINKALKRYHRERYGRWDDVGLTKSDIEKELWKNLRMKRNDRGEIVLFT